MGKKNLVAAVSGIALFSAPAFATENGSQHYPVGVNTVSDGNLPPPGMLQMLDYFQVAPTPDIRDAHGEKINTRFDLTAEANAMKFLYTWKGLEIAGLHYTTGFVLPIVHLNLDAGGAKGRDFGIGDVTVQNYLGGSNAKRTFMYFFGLDTYIPTGNYGKTNVINTGSNYFTFAPNVNFTVIPSSRWELTGTVFSEFNTTNKATHYHSGSDVDLDYGVTYRPFAKNRNFGFGINGFFYKQLGNDTIDGAKVDADGYKGRVFAIGPQVRYDVPFGGFVLKYQHEYAVVNRPSGEQIWFQFAVPLTGIPHKD